MSMAVEVSRVRERSARWSDACLARGIGDAVSGRMRLDHSTHLARSNLSTTSRDNPAEAAMRVRRDKHRIHHFTTVTTRPTALATVHLSRPTSLPHDPRTQ